MAYPSPQSPEPPEGAYPIDVIARYPQTSSRGLALLAVLFFLKAALLIPHFIVLWFLSLAAAVVMFIGYWAVLILGHYPRSMWDFLVGFTRWQTRVNAWLLGLTDQYPPFSLK